MTIFSGATFANQIGLTAQMPGTLETITMKESTKGRNVQICSQPLQMKCSPLEINIVQSGYGGAACSTGRGHPIRAEGTRRSAS